MKDQYELARYQKRKNQGQSSLTRGGDGYGNQNRESGRSVRSTLLSTVSTDSGPRCHLTHISDLPAWYFETKQRLLIQRRLVCWIRILTVSVMILIVLIVLATTGVLLYVNKSTPEFYQLPNYEGRAFVAPWNWQSKSCINLPAWANDGVMSLRAKGHCVQLFENEDCHLTGQWDHRLFTGRSIKTLGFENIQGLEMEGKVTSFRRC